MCYRHPWADSRRNPRWHSLPRRLPHLLAPLCQPSHRPLPPESRLPPHPPAQQGLPPPRPEPSCAQPEGAGAQPRCPRSLPSCGTQSLPPASYLPSRAIAPRHRKPSGRTPGRTRWRSLRLSAAGALARRDPRASQGGSAPRSHRTTPRRPRSCRRQRSHRRQGECSASWRGERSLLYFHLLPRCVLSSFLFFPHRKHTSNTDRRGSGRRGPAGARPGGRGVCAGASRHHVAALGVTDISRGSRTPRMPLRAVARQADAGGGISLRHPAWALTWPLACRSRAGGNPRARRNATLA